MSRNGLIESKRVALWLIGLICSMGTGPGMAQSVEESFDSLEAWEPLTFPKIEAHSTYRIVEEAGRSVLQAESQASASGLISAQPVDVYAHPRLTWRWKVANVYSNRSVQKKDGDDYPIRLYVLFVFDPDEASFGERMKYRAARLVHGAYPPHSTLNYVWASAADTPPFYPNPYTDRARMIPLRRGSDQVGEWVEEAVHMVDDYRRAFGEDPPREARLAIMSDSDNTGEAATAWIDWIRSAPLAGD